jgi:hypothetical protein
MSSPSYRVLARADCSNTWSCASVGTWRSDDNCPRNCHGDDRSARKTTRSRTYRRQRGARRLSRCAEDCTPSPRASLHDWTDPSGVCKVAQAAGPAERPSYCRSSTRLGEANGTPEHARRQWTPLANMDQSCSTVCPVRSRQGKEDRVGVLLLTRSPRRHGCSTEGEASCGGRLGSGSWLPARMRSAARSAIMTVGAWWCDTSSRSRSGRTW